jgi:hypothetical protein
VVAVSDIDTEQIEDGVVGYRDGRARVDDAEKVAALVWSVQRNEWPPHRGSIGKGRLAEVMMFVNPLAQLGGRSAEADEKWLVSRGYR